AAQAVVELGPVRSGVEVTTGDRVLVADPTGQQRAGSHDQRAGAGSVPVLVHVVGQAVRTLFRDRRGIGVTVQVDPVQVPQQLVVTARRPGDRALGRDHQPGGR